MLSLLETLSDEEGREFHRPAMRDQLDSRGGHSADDRDYDAIAARAFAEHDDFEHFTHWDLDLEYEREQGGF